MMSEDKKDKKLSATDWMRRINRAKKYRESIADKQKWSDILKAYEGEYQVDGSVIRQPAINMVFGYTDTAIARLYARDPYISVNAGRGNTIQRAHLLEKAVNYEKKSMGLKGTVEKVLRDAILVGHGWIKYGFIGIVGEKPVETSSQNNPSDAAIENVSEFIKDGEVFVSHVPFEDIVFDTDLATDPPYDCRWIAHRIVKPVSAWKASKFYENTGSITSNISVLDTDGKKVDERLKDADQELFEAWEVHDKDSNRIYVVAESLDKFMRNEENVKEMLGLPFSMLKFNPIPKKPYPLSDIFLIMPQILERIRLRGAQLSHIKRWSRQLSVEKGSMSEIEMEKFAMGQDGAVTQREKGSVPPTPIQYAPLQDEIFLLDDLIQKDMDTTIGQNEVDRGGETKGKGKATKYEIQQQQQGTAGRGQKRQDKLEDFLGEVFSKIIALMKQFQTTEKYVSITGMTASQVTEELGLGPDKVTEGAGGISFTKDDIQGEYDIEVKAGSTLPMNKENRIRVIEGLLNVMPNMGMQPGNPLQIAVLSELLRELDMQEAIKAFDEMKTATPQPNPGPQGAPGNLPPGGPAPVAPPAPVQPPPGQAPLQ